MLRDNLQAQQMVLCTTRNWRVLKSTITYVATEEDLSVDILCNVPKFSVEKLNISRFEGCFCCFFCYCACLFLNTKGETMNLSIVNAKWKMKTNSRKHLFRAMDGKHDCIENEILINDVSLSSNLVQVVPSKAKRTCRESRKEVLITYNL